MRACVCDLRKSVTLSGHQMLKTCDLSHHFVTFICHDDVSIDCFYSFGRGPEFSGSGNGVTS